MHSIRLSLLAFTVVTTLASADEGSGRSASSAVVQEMNLARQNPQRYATYVEELRGTFDGATMVLPGGKRFRTKEGAAAIDEAIRFLRSAQPLPPLAFSGGMSHAASDHCADQVGGAMGHKGSDRSNPGARMNRYGSWGLGWGENIAYGKSKARDIVIALIVDDGLRERKHRKNIFSSTFAFAGAAIGTHAKYGAVCSIEFAGAYAEQGEAPSGQLIARNF